MKRNKIIGILVLTSLLFVSFGNISYAQTPDYIGVKEDDEFTWKIKIDLDGINTLVYNIKDVLVDQKAKLSEMDLFGFESLTIPESVNVIVQDIITNILPFGWEDLNISTFIRTTIDYYVIEFNSTVLSGKIPANWESLIFSVFYDLVVEGLNETMTPSWEVTPIPELIKLAINELNSSVLGGLIPDGWENLNLSEFLDKMMIAASREVWESAIFHMLKDLLLELMYPTEFPDFKMGDLIENITLSIFRIEGLNATAMLDNIFVFLNSTHPTGLETETVSFAIDYLIDQINSTLPNGYDEMAMSDILAIGIEEYLSYMFYGVPLDLTIPEMLDAYLTQMIESYTLYVLPAWDDFMLLIETSEVLPKEIGLKIIIDNIGTEYELYPDGPKGVPVNITSFISFDMENWMDLTEWLDLYLIPFIEALFGISIEGPPPLRPSMVPVNNVTLFFNPYMFLETPVIIDPSTYTNAQTTLADQSIFSGYLFVANNYDWGTIQNEMIISTENDAKCIATSVDWNKNGILKDTFIKASGQRAISLTLLEGEEEIIPGYLLPITLGIIAFVSAGIILYMKKRKYIINQT